jgi:hypothetical protein
LTTTVNNIEHIESNSFNGINVIKVYLQLHASVNAAIAETTAACQAILKALPPGITPPNILSYNAANVPVLQLSVAYCCVIDRRYDPPLSGFLAKHRCCGNLYPTLNLLLHTGSS